MVEGISNEELDVKTDDLDKSMQIAKNKIRETGKVSRKWPVNRSPSKSGTTGRWHSLASESPGKYETVEIFEVSTKRKRVGQLLSDTVKKRDLKQVAVDFQEGLNEINVNLTKQKEVE